MKTCSKCGSEIMDDAVICVSCGCMVEENPQAADPNIENLTEIAQPKKGKKSLVKKIIMITALILVLAALIIAALYGWNYYRVAKVKEQLAGRTFIYSDFNYFSYDIKKISFDDDAQMTYYYYFSSIDAANEYQESYEIEFDGDMVFLITFADKYEIQYDRYGKIESLYDIDAKETYE